MCRSKSSFRDDDNLHVSISVLGEAMVWQVRLNDKCASAWLLDVTQPLQIVHEVIGDLICP